MERMMKMLEIRRKRFYFMKMQTMKMKTTNGKGKNMKN